MPLSPGTRLGVYEILGTLGAGGMGEVYRAHDARLGRDVALKVLHPDVAQDAARLERFTREARAVAALSHPHIVTIYSTEEADGVRFMTMELVEGRSLDELIPAEGLSIPRFVRFALPLADALTAAAVASSASSASRASAARPSWPAAAADARIASSRVSRRRSRSAARRLGPRGNPTRSPHTHRLRTSLHGTRPLPRPPARPHRRHQDGAHPLLLPEGGLAGQRGSGTWPRSIA